MWKYNEGSVFDRIGQASATLGWIAMMGKRASPGFSGGLAACQPSEIQEYAAARMYLMSLLLEAETSEARRNWFIHTNDRIIIFNKFRGTNRIKIKSMEQLLHDLVDDDWVVSEVKWEIMQQRCIELGSVASFLERHIRDEANNALKPFQALLK